MPGHTSRGQQTISKEGMAALAFALTVAMMGVTGGLLIQGSGGLSDGGPIVTATTDPVDASNGPDGQWLRIGHESGDIIDVGNLTVEVSVPSENKRASIHGLPTDYLRQDDYDGNHLFTIGPHGVADAAEHNDTDRAWTAGEDIAVRIEPRRVDLEAGDEVRVTVVHDPTSKQLYEASVDVVDYAE